MYHPTSLNALLILNTQEKVKQFKENSEVSIWILFNISSLENNTI